MSDVFNATHFETSELAREWLEQVRWPKGPICSHCGAINHAYQIKKPGWYRCAKKECRKDFTVTTGTIMERSHIPLNKWLIGFHMMASNRVSAHQLHLTLDLGYKSAWFMSHRIREAMRSDGPALSSLLGISDYCNLTDRFNLLKKSRVILYSKIGNSILAYKHVIVGLVQSAGNVGTFRARTASKITISDSAHASRLHHLYIEADQNSVAHKRVKYSGGANINAVDNFVSIFKRGMRGVHHHCSRKHLHRYMAEFDFRHNHRTGLGYSETDRTVAAIKGAKGKRLIYRQSPDNPRARNGP